MAQSGQPIPVHHDDVIRQIPALLDAATSPATILNWGGDEVVSVEEWTRFMAEIAGASPTFETTELTIPSAVIDTSVSRPILGPCEVGWRYGFRRLTEQILADQA